MADYFEPPAKEEEKIKLGDTEYTQEELTKLVGLGLRAEDLAKNHGSFDKFITEAGRRAEEIGRLKGVEKEAQELKAKLEEYENKKEVNTGELKPEEIQKAREALQTVLGGEVVTTKQLDAWYQNRRSGERLLDECEELEAEINGGDGRPKFEKQSVLEHMASTGIKNPLKAYKDMYEDKLDEWKQSQLNKAKGEPFVTNERGAQDKQPAPVKVTRANLDQLVKETLYGVSQE